MGPVQLGLTNRVNQFLFFVLQHGQFNCQLSWHTFLAWFIHLTSPEPDGTDVCFACLIECVCITIWESVLTNSIKDIPVGQIDATSSYLLSANCLVKLASSWNNVRSGPVGHLWIQIPRYVLIRRLDFNVTWRVTGLSLEIHRPTDRSDRHYHCSHTTLVIDIVWFGFNESTRMFDCLFGWNIFAKRMKF